MHRSHVLELLNQYELSWAAGKIPFENSDLSGEAYNLNKLRKLVKSEIHCLERSNVSGHITASALVTNDSYDMVLLTLHAKLGKWIQLGGHLEGEFDPSLAALREAQEESGLAKLEFGAYEGLLDSKIVSYPLLFDIDIHSIPAQPGENEHLHYDLRFLCQAQPKWPLKITQESKDLRWFNVNEAGRLNDEPSMIRQFDKLLAIKTKLLLQ